MSRKTRTFIAVKVPEPGVAALRKLRERISPDLPGLRWVEPEQLHLTLAFLGDVDQADLVPLCQSIAQGLAGYRRFGLQLQGLGAFPTPGRPRVLWAGLVGDDLEALHEVQKAVVSAAREAGYPPADDRFHPHITLGRFKFGPGQSRRASPMAAAQTPAGDLSALLQRQRHWSGGAFPIGEVVTFASTLSPQGPIHAPLATVTLASAKRKGPT
ncbi:RNA 2',3'-cyclic phosphodiesterase [soil metagenome]